MPPTFTITTPAPTIPANATGNAEVIFTVANTSGVPSRAIAKITTYGNTRVEWLSITGETEREMPVNGNQQFTVVANVPQDVPQGNYPFRLDVVSARKTSEERVEGPMVTLAVPPRTAPPPKKSYWWIIIAVLALLVVGAVAAYLMTRKNTDAATTDTATSGTSGTDTANTATASGTDTANTATASGTDTADTATASGTDTSTGKDETYLAVPNMFDKRRDIAKAELEKMGLVPKVNEILSDDVEVGRVAKQAPAPGWSVKPGREVFLYVSKGSKTVIVPSVIKLQWSTAKTVLEKAGLQPKRVNTKAFLSVLAERVEDQKPVAGQKVPRGQVVEVMVATH